MATLQEILANAQLADTTEFEIGGNKLTVTEARKFAAAIEGEKRIAALKRQEAEKLADDAATRIAGRTNQQKRTAAAKPAADANAYDWKTDPLYAPVVG